MLSVKNIGSNQTEVRTSKANVLVSYSTPVAAFILGEGYVKTDEHYSVTTSKHINAWLRSNCQDPASVKQVPQSYLDNLL